MGAQSISCVSEMTKTPLKHYLFQVEILETTYPRISQLKSRNTIPFYLEQKAVPPAKYHSLSNTIISLFFLHQNNQFICITLINNLKIFSESDLRQSTTLSAVDMILSARRMESDSSVVPHSIRRRFSPVCYGVRCSAFWLFVLFAVRWV